jgi:hypothetical protein
LIYSIIIIPQKCAESKGVIEAAYEAKNKLSILHDQRIAELRKELTDCSNKAAILEVCLILILTSINALHF